MGSSHKHNSGLKIPAHTTLARRGVFVRVGCPGLTVIHCFSVHSDNREKEHYAASHVSLLISL